MSTTPRTDEVYDRRLAPEKPGITWHELGKQLETELIHLHSQLERLKTSGITELAAINPSVADYCKHWEARAEKAEAALQKIKDVMREDSNGKDPMDAVQDIITATKEASK